MELPREDAEKNLRKRLGFVDGNAPALPDLDYSQELIHSNRPVNIGTANFPSSDEMMMAV